jgi:hypothetical protein
MISKVQRAGRNQSETIRGAGGIKRTCSFFYVRF